MIVNSTINNLRRYHSGSISLQSPFLSSITNRHYQIPVMSKFAIPKPHVRYIEPRELKDLIIKNQGQIKKDYAIIDVRDSDFVGGNILSMKNIPSKSFHGFKASLAEQLRTTPYVIFHCALSQVRGPKCARIYHQLLSESVSPDNQLEATQEIMILRGGFTAWQQLYRDESSLVENFDKELWDNME